MSDVATYAGSIVNGFSDANSPSRVGSDAIRSSRDGLSEVLSERSSHVPQDICASSDFVATRVEPHRSAPSLGQASRSLEARNESGRLAVVDACKGIAACLIVLHHLSAYGRPAALASQIAPGAMDFLFDHARMIVQLFLVFGGFAMAWTASERELSFATAFRSIGKRYLRLAAPYFAMLAFLLLLVVLVGGDSDEHPLIESFTAAQLFAHLFFLQDLLGFSHFSAGTWYLCIDIQFAILFCLGQAAVCCGKKRLGSSMPSATLLALGLAPLGLASTWYWNRYPGFDFTVLYFLGSLVLGALIGWERRGKVSLWFVIAYALAMAASLLIDFRPRLVVALGSAAFLWLAVQSFPNWRGSKFWNWLGKISYSLFLIHFSMNWLVMKATDPWMEDSPVRALVVIGLCFAASLIAGTLLHYGVELPTLRWMKRGWTWDRWTKLTSAPAGN